MSWAYHFHCPENGSCTSQPGKNVYNTLPKPWHPLCVTTDAWPKSEITYTHTHTRAHSHINTYSGEPKQRSEIVWDFHSAWLSCFKMTLCIKHAHLVHLARISLFAAPYLSSNQFTSFPAVRWTAWIMRRNQIIQIKCFKMSECECVCVKVICKPFAASFFCVYEIGERKQNEFSLFTSCIIPLLGIFPKLANFAFHFRQSKKAVRERERGGGWSAHWNALFGCCYRCYTYANASNQL